MNQEKSQNRRYLVLLSGGILSILVISAVFLVGRQKTAQNQAVVQCIASPLPAPSPSLSPSPSPLPFLGSNYPVNKETLEQLKSDICKNLIGKYESSSNLNWYWNLIILFGTLITTLIVSVIDDIKIRAFLGGLAASLVSIRAVIPVERWSTFHQSLAADGRALLIRLKYSVTEPAEFQEVVREYEKVIIRAGQESPLVSPSSNLNVSPNESNTEVNSKPNATPTE
ncbi:MAG: hypothetical protein KME32_12315 [Mojavia pulchra JT2-VF2]|jgi:hypothetical protein|uniref:Uncharacterized protein n=1 Tax=Mojavia pulchra JT2-VF2 TaxID=287848 RepID=A0A951PZ27_9NOST|nr:hypothetical protein [Mojavia pulchra JT2-VF2]